MAVPENYRLIKLQNGDDLISECFESPDDKNHIVLIRPMQIQIAVGFDGSGNSMPSRLIMTEWMAFSQENTVALPLENVLSFGKPTEQIAAVYDKEKLRIAERSKLELKSEVKTAEQVQAEKARQRKINKRKKMILIQMSVETLLRMLESLGVDVDDEPWKSIVNPPDDDDDEDDDDDDDDEESPNLDGTLDLRPDVDGDGLVDPYGNRWPE